MEQISDTEYSENDIIFTIEDYEDNRWNLHIGQGGNGPDNQKFTGMINIDGREYKGYLYLESEGDLSTRFHADFGNDIIERDTSLIYVFLYNFINSLEKYYTIKKPPIEALRIYKIRGILNDQQQ